MNWVCEEGKAGFWQEIRTDKQETDWDWPNWESESINEGMRTRDSESRVQTLKCGGLLTINEEDDDDDDV